jgi:hypothetical protein
VPECRRLRRGHLRTGRSSRADPEFLESEYLQRQADAACELQLVLDPDLL